MLSVLLGVVLCVSAFSQVNKNVPVTAKSNPHLKVFDMALVTGDVNTAITALNYYITEQGSNNPYADTLAMLYMQQGSFAQCYYWADKRLAAKPDDNGLLEMKGICLEKLNDYDNALAAYVELTYSYPKSPLVSDAIIRLGQYFYKNKNYDVAGKVFGNFQQRNPEHELAAKALFLSAQSYMKGAEDRKQQIGSGQYDAKGTEWLNEGIQKFNHLIGTYEDKDLRSESMYWLADCYMKVGDPKGAYQTFKKLTWDYPETKWAKFARGQLAQNSQAFEQFEREE